MFVKRLFPFVLAALALALPVRADEGKEGDEEQAKETPQEAFEAFKKAVKAKDGDTAWAFFSSATRKKIVEQMEPMLATVKGDAESMKTLSEKTGKSVEELEKMETEEFVKTLMVGEMTGDSDDIENVEWLGAEVKGNEAICRTKDKGKEKEEKVVLVLEKGRWKLDMEKTEKLNRGEDGGDDDEDTEDEDSDDDEGKKEEGSDK